MNATSFLRLIASALLTVSLAGCQLNTQEAADEPVPFKLGGPTANCFAPSLESVERYFRSQATESEMDGAFTCFSGALDMFATYSRGSKGRDALTTQELRTFLERYFLGDLRLTDGLLAEVMRVKQALLGGANDRLTKIEIRRLIEVLEVLHREANRLRPFVAILNLSLQPEDPSIDAAFLEQGISDFAFTMDTLGSLLGQSKQPYRLENLRSLLVEFQGLYRGRSNWKGPDWFAERMPLIAATKALLIRPGGAQIEPDEWRLLFSHVGRMYGLYLRLQYAITGRDLNRGEGLNQLDIGLSEVFDIVSGAISSKPDGKLSYALINEFLDALDAANPVDLPIKISTIRTTLPVLFERVFNPIQLKDFGVAVDPADPKSAKGERREQGGLTSVNLSRIRDGFAAWIEMQHLWERLETEAARRNSNAYGQPVPIQTAREIWDSFRPVHHEAWGDLKSLFDRPLPLATRPNGTLQFVRGADVAIDFASFTALNWKQALVRALGYGYVSDPDSLRMSGVTSPQFERVFNDFRAVAVDLQFLDPNDVTIWKTGFTIANIFLFSSDGNDRLGFHEAVDLFVFAFSSASVAKPIRKVVDQNCEPREPDPLGLPRIDSKCWRKTVKDGYFTFLADLPGWIKQAKVFDDGYWQGFFHYLEQAVRKGDSPGGRLSSSEMDRAISIHHYVEALYVRWDANRDGRLSRKEASKAFYLFKNLLTEASGFDNEDDVMALYMYLLAYGQPPDKSRIADVVHWLWWRGNSSAWDSRVRANRARVTQIFGALASEI